MSTVDRSSVKLTGLFSPLIFVLDNGYLEPEETQIEKRDRAHRREGTKRDRNDKGYIMFEPEDSDDELMRGNEKYKYFLFYWLTFILKENQFITIKIRIKDH